MKILSIQSLFCKLTLIAFFLAAPALQAQSSQSVSIRLLDGKTGLSVKASNFLVRVDHQQLEHGDWVKKNEDGTGALTLPAHDAGGFARD